MRIQLKRPIVVFDLETTGVNITRDRIVEISMIKVMPNTYERITFHRYINPEMPIPPEATAVHHISDADVANAPTFKQVAREIENMLMGCDLAGFNSSNFDIPMLSQEFSRVGLSHDFSRHNFVDVQTIYHKKEPRNLSAAYRFYCGKGLEGAHSAGADTLATLEVLEAQLDKYTDLPDSIEALSKFGQHNQKVDLMGRIIMNSDGKETINFGKYKGRTVEEVLRTDPGYYGWVLGGDFPQDTKDVLTRIKLRLGK